uniref:B2126_C3_261 n=1 Tax=Mycobacterium leprae TaxID=1769 RepID=Q49793_MYCLR|nr:B2126_C3_261 [Mycobacterium leprae]
MKIADANVLLYSGNTSSEHTGHPCAGSTVRLSCADRIGFGWVPLLVFVRPATKMGLVLRTMSSEDAIGQVADWLTGPSAVLMCLTVRHAAFLVKILV